MKGERNGLMMVASVAVGALFALNPFALPAQQATVLWVLVLCGALWLTEALPLHVTALVIPVLLAVFGKFTVNAVFTPFFDPVVVLLLGGFVMAVALQKHSLDRRIALSFVHLFGRTPKRFLLGIMVASAFLSFWITNSATTSLILPIAIAVLAANKMRPGKSTYAKALVLGVAFAATIGGMGTIIGSTPNVIVTKFLADQGIQITFTSWMYYALPFTLLLLPLAWLVLITMFPSGDKPLLVRHADPHTSRPQRLVLAVFALTVLLWLTTEWHGYSASLVALVPVILLYALGLLDTDDFSKAQWPTLVLFGGGLSLGTAISASGLDSTLAGVLQSFVFGQALWLIFLAVIAFSMLLTVMASNTAAASILVPIAIPLAAAIGVDVRTIALLAALGVSLDFLVPVGTPPNAIAYASGYVRVWDMAKAGAVIAVIAALLLTGLALLYW
jgi:sodium-dependent dicarboxylate transporter 2/3/5